MLDNPFWKAHFAHGAAKAWHPSPVQVTGNAEISNLLQIMGPLAKGWPFRVSGPWSNGGKVLGVKLLTEVWGD